MSQFRRDVATCLGVGLCECVAEDTLLDNGQSAAASDDIVVLCRDHRCQTALRGEPQGSSAALPPALNTPSATHDSDRNERSPEWVAARDELLAEYADVLPVSQQEQEWAEKAALRAASEAELPPRVQRALDPKRSSGELLKNWCRRKVNYPEPQPLEQCVLEELGLGSVLLLTLTTECGGDACSTASYVLSARHPVLVAVPGDFGSGAAASPAGDALFVSELTDLVLTAPDEAKRAAPFGGSSEIILERISLPSFERQAFAPCFSPTLSPGGAWILCRDRAANVLKVPVGGGTPIVIARSDLSPQQIAFVWYAYIWPQAVEFTAPDRLRFSIARSGGEVVERELVWQE